MDSSLLPWGTRQTPQSPDFKLAKQKTLNSCIQGAQFVFTALGSRTPACHCHLCLSPLEATSCPVGCDSQAMAVLILFLDSCSWTQFKVTSMQAAWCIPLVRFQTEGLNQVATVGLTPVSQIGTP